MRLRLNKSQQYLTYILQNRIKTKWNLTKTNIRTFYLIQKRENRKIWKKNEIFVCCYIYFGNYSSNNKKKNIYPIYFYRDILKRKNCIIFRLSYALLRESRQILLQGRLMLQARKFRHQVMLVLITKKVHFLKHIVQLKESIITNKTFL